jgi:hypothetical protein
MLETNHTSVFLGQYFSTEKLEEIFKETCFGENNEGSDFKTVMIYAGIIRNFECPALLNKMRKDKDRIHNSRKDARKTPMWRI